MKVLHEEQVLVRDTQPSLTRSQTDQFRGLTVSFRSILVYLAQGIFLTAGSRDRSGIEKKINIFVVSSIDEATNGRPPFQLVW